MSLKEINRTIENSSIFSPDKEDTITGFDIFYEFYNIPSLRNEIKSLNGCAFTYLEAVINNTGVEMDGIDGQHIFLMDDMLLAVDFQTGSWGGGSVGTEAYPVYPVKIDTAIDIEETRYAKLRPAG